MGLNEFMRDRLAPQQAEPTLQEKVEAELAKVCGHVGVVDAAEKIIALVNAEIAGKDGSK